MSLTRMGEDLLKGRPSGRKTWRIKKGQRFEQEGIEGSPRDGLPTCSVNPCGEAWESWVCVFLGTSKTGKAKLELANARAPGSRNSQAQWRAPRVWAPSQDAPVTSTHRPPCQL